MVNLNTKIHSTLDTLGFSNSFVVPKKRNLISAQTGKKPQGLSEIIFLQQFFNKPYFLVLSI